MSNLIPHWIANHLHQNILRGQFQAAALCVDISGFTPLTEALLQHHRDGAEVLGQALNGIFAPLVAEVYAHGGFIAGFAGDAFTALFPYGQRSAGLEDAVLSSCQEAAGRACQVARFVERFFVAQSQLPTRYGTFTLGVKVGLGLGAVHWGILGSSGRYSYFFRGPAVARCVQAERQAKAGQVIADRSIKPHIQTQIETASQARFSQITAWSPAVDWSRFSSPAILPPAPLSRAAVAPFVADGAIDLAWSGAQGEFRFVASVFINFRAPDEPVDLNAFVALVLELVQQYDGYFKDLDFGDKGPVIVCTFGAPLAHENDLERAADFLLSLAQKEQDVSWRAGLAYGTVYAGVIGGVERGEYTALGDVVNLAARLMQQAHWEQCWMSEVAAERLRHSHRVERLGRFALKGKAGQVPAWRLIGRRTAAAPLAFAGKMVGREDELAALLDFLQPLQAGRFAGVATLLGEAGMGKSRLAYEVHQHLAAAYGGEVGRDGGARWFICPTDDILRQALNPFQHWLRYYLDQLPDRSSEVNRERFDRRLDVLIAELGAAGLPLSQERQGLVEELERTRSFLGALLDLRWAGSLYEQLDPRLRFENTLLALKALILAESLRQPLVLQLEDVHCLDSASEEMVQLLTRNVANYPLALLCTSRYRDDGGLVQLKLDEDVPQLVIQMETLTTAGIQALASQLLGGAIGEDLSSFLVKKTQGNPFFVEQLVLDLRERGTLFRGQDGWGLSTQVEEVPVRIEAVLIARLDRLAAEVKEVVQTAAVLGQEFELQVLSRMLRETPNMADIVQQAEAERVWTALREMHYIFRHALMRDAAYEMQLRARLRDLHRLAAETIEQLYAQELAPYYADLAYHYGRAGDIEHECRYARLAGEQAAARFANTEAIVHLSRALDLTPEDDWRDRVQLLLAREAIYHLQGNRQAELQDLDAAEALLDIGEGAEGMISALRLEILQRRARYAEVTGAYPAAIATAQRAIDLARVASNVRGEVKANFTCGQAYRHQGDFAQARQSAEKGLALAQQSSLLLEEAEGMVLLGTIAAGQGDPDSALSYMERSLRLAREVGHVRLEASVLVNLGNIFVDRGELERGWPYYEEALGTFHRMGFRRGEGTVLNNMGNMATRAHDYARARALLKQALPIRRDIGDRLGESIVMRNLGVALMALGEYKAAQDHFERSLALSCRIGDRSGESGTRSNLSLLYHLLGDQETARVHGEQAAALAGELGDRWVQGYGLTHLGHALTSLGRLEEAELAYGQALKLRRETGSANLVAETQAGQARAALAGQDLPGALDHVKEILSFLEAASSKGGRALQGNEEPLRIYLTCYQVLIAKEDLRAEEILAAARRELDAQAGRIPDEATRRSFLENVAAHRKIVRLGALTPHSSS